MFSSRILAVLLFCVVCTACAAPHSSVEPATVTLHALLQDLAALPDPAGMSEKRFRELKSALASALQDSDRTRFTSAAPSGAAGAVGDLSLTNDGFGWMLKWTYRNKGDYDQNRQVTIGDLTALGANLGKGAAAGDWLTRAIAADGDANGEVTISDITPIGANLLATVLGYVVQSSDTPESEGAWQDLDEIGFDDSSIFAENALRQFSIQLFPPPTPNRWYRVVPFDGSDRGVPSNAVQFSQVVPQVTAVNPISGTAGTAVTFVATYNGTPAAWSWDFGGGAAPNIAGAVSPTVTLGASGTYAASVTVSSAAGSSTFNFGLEVVDPAPPEIEDVQPQTGVEDQQASFAATLSGGAVATYVWDFGAATAPSISADPEPLVLLAQEGQWPVSLTVSNAGGSDTYNFVLDIASSPNIDPHAAFTATPVHGDPGDPVALDAAESFDPDGTIVKYEFDLDGDDVFDTDESVPQSQTALPDPAASVMVMLRVTDNDGATATTSLQLSSLPSGWYQQRLVENGDSGRHPSLAVINGLPAISFLNATNGDLMYIGAANPEGSAWHAPVPVDEVSNVGHFTSMLEVKGKPAISYYDADLGDLLYVRALDAEGTAWAAPEHPDSAGIVGAYSSLAIVAGFPAIAYSDQANTATKYIRANDENGDIWGGPLTVADEGFVGNYTSLAVIAGLPSISYTDNIDGELKYVRAITLEGGQWDPPVLADGTSFALYTSMIELDGLPAIAYCDANGGGDLKLVRALDPQGSNWNPPQTLDSTGNVGRFPSLALIAGLPAVAYWDFTNGDLRFVQSSLADGSAWESPLTVDSAGDVGQYNCLREINGMAAIAYYDYLTLDLKYAVLLP